MRQAVAVDIRGVFQAPNREQAEVDLKQVVTMYAILLRIWRTG